MVLSRALCLLLLVACVVGQSGLPVPRITQVGGYPLEFLRAPQPGTPVQRLDNLPTVVPLRPLSMRVVYRPNTGFGGVGAVGTAEEDMLHGMLVINGDGFLASPTVTVAVKLIDPTATDCRTPGLNMVEMGPTSGLAAPYNDVTVTRSTTLAYFMIPALASQTPHEHLMPWICVCTSMDNPAAIPPFLGCADGVGGTSNWIHTNMRLAQVQGCLGDNVEFAAFSALSTTPVTIYPILGIKTLYTPFLCQASIQNAPTPLPAKGTGLGIDMTPQPIWGESNDDGQPSATTGPFNRLFIERRMRTKCCGWRDDNIPDPANFLPSGNGIFMRRRFGVCINPLLESCCNRYEDGQGVQRGMGLTTSVGSIGGSGKPYSRFREKCCFGGIFNSVNQVGTVATSTANPLGAIREPQPVLTSYLDDFCPCKKDQVNFYCNQQVPQAGNSNGCCVNSKYPEIVATASTIPPATLPVLWGKCFDGVYMKCCDTGDVYDAGSKQCCKINGVQSLNIPCPCSQDAHCWANQTCCQDITRPQFPTPTEDLSRCNKYTNFPTGTGPYMAQPCIGQCIDTRFQICCNGMACIDSYEVCCNSTCCNKFSQRCTMGLRAGALRQLHNRIDYRVPYEVCTEMEGMTPFRAILAYLLPIFLLAATFVSLFATLNFTKRQSSLQPLSIYEKSMFVAATISILLAWPLFFSPLYKYGIVWIWAMFFVMLASLSQLRSLNIAAVIILGILLIYVIDPFYGNEILTLASNRIPPPMSGVYGWSGVLGSIVMNAVGDYGYCTNWYDYFRRDPLVEDPRLNNPTVDLMDTSVPLSHHTYGFCARGWFVTLAVLEGINIIVSYFAFFLTLVTHIRNILFEKAQRTDDVVREPWY